MPEKRAILIVDDDALVSGPLKDALEEDGVEAICCEGAAEALGLMREGCFRAIIIDFEMPAMDGISLTGLVRLRCPDAFIIGYSGKPKGKDFLDAGADAFFEKPFLLHDLVSLIKQKTWITP